MPEIGVVQLRIMAALGQQFVVRAFLDNPTMVYDDDPVSGLTRKSSASLLSPQKICQPFFSRLQKISRILQIFLYVLNKGIVYGMIRYEGNSQRE